MGGFDVSQHWYSPEGELVEPGTEGAYPSVTTILDVRNKPGLTDWKLRVGEEEAYNVQQTSAKLGTIVHKWIETFLTKGKVAEDITVPEFALARPYIEGFLAWHDKVQPKNCATELFICSNIHEYSGTTDLVCEIDKELWVIDFKTSKRIDEGFGLQLAAYVEAVKEMNAFKLWPRRAVLQLTQEIKRGYRFKEFDDEMDFSVFLAHKEIFNWEQKISPKKRAPQYQLNGNLLELA